jgi:hypothetical protein
MDRRAEGREADMETKEELRSGTVMTAVHDKRFITFLI